MPARKCWRSVGAHWWKDARYAASLMCVVLVNPKPPSVMESKTRTCVSKSGGTMRRWLRNWAVRRSSAVATFGCQANDPCHVRGITCRKGSPEGLGNMGGQTMFVELCESVGRLCPLCKQHVVLWQVVCCIL